MTDDALIVREACLDDLDLLAKFARKEAGLAQQLAGYYRLAPDFDWVALTRDKLNRVNLKILVVENGGGTIGFIEIRIRKYPAPAPSKSRLWFLSRRRAPRGSSPLEPLSLGVIEGIFVEAAYRRGGAGKVLMTAGLAWLRQKGIRRVELGVLASNAEGRKFWQRSGFQTYRLLMYRNLDDAGQADEGD